MSAETRDERKRRLAAERQRRRRKRLKKGDLHLVVPADIADELGDDENRAAAANEILRRHVVARVRDSA